MAARVGPTTVSYGIGVQNRYSAFLEEEDAFIPQTIQPLSTSVGKGLTADGKKVAKTSSTSKANSKPSSSRQDVQQKQGQAASGQKSAFVKVDSSKRNPQKIGQQNNDSQGLKHNPKRSTQLQSDTNSGVKQSRNQQSNGVQNDIKDKLASGQNLAGKISNRVNKDQRPNNRPRPVDHEEGKRAYNGQDTPQTDANYSFSAEEEKRRRQQKRTNDLRYKDQEKREAKRNQPSFGGSDDQHQQNKEPNSESDKSGDNPERPNGLKNRREGENNIRNLKNNRGRPYRNQDNEDGTNFEKRADGQMQDRRRNDGEGPRRIRNGFGRGINPRANDRGLKNEKGVIRNQERPKPIPNFSDKSDFPSLAS